jgi:hypothetical protein
MESLIQTEPLKMDITILQAGKKRWHDSWIEGLEKLSFGDTVHNSPLLWCRRWWYGSPMSILF